MTNKKIILFFPKIHQNSSWFRVPLSLLAIAAPLKNHSIKIIDANLEKNYESLVLNEVEDALCLGISSMTGYQIFDGLKISKLIKKRYPHIPIVWGGWHSSILPKQTAESPFVDVVVKGQGELIFKELIHCFKNNLPLSNVKGIVFKDENKIIETPNRPFEDINNFPPLPYDILNVERYIRKTEFGLRTLNYISSQGCPFNCGFCAEPFVNKQKYSALNSERVINEIKAVVKKYNLDSIIFDDNNLFMEKERIKKICLGLIDLNIKWGQANGRVDQLIRFEPDLWELMKKSGCKSILIGAESGSDKILNIINKKIRVQDTIKLIKIASKYQIPIECSIMLGYPQDPYDELKKTLSLITQIYSISSIHKILLFYYTPYPGTGLYQMALRHGLKAPRGLEAWSRFDLDHVNTPWLSNRYKRIVQSIMDYYLFLVFPGNKIRILMKKGLLGFLIRILHKLAKFRWKHGFFSLPVEYSLFKLFKKSIFKKIKNR